MNKKELMLSAFNMMKTPVQPVTPHWWGVYKFQYADIAGVETAGVNGADGRTDEVDGRAGGSDGCANEADRRARRHKDAWWIWYLRS